MPILSKIKRLEVEAELYKRGFNVALLAAEDTNFFKSFRNQLRKALFEQIEFVAKDSKKMDQLVALKKLSMKQLALSFIASKSIGTLVDFAKFLVWGGTQGGQATLDELKLGGVFNLTDPELISFFDDHTRLLITSVDDFTAKWIAMKIKRGKTEGLSTMQIAETLINDGKDISKIRAQRIAVNELINAMTVVELEAAERLGIQEIIWRTSIDDRVCPICLPLEGDKVEVGEEFDTSVGPVKGPPAHVSCRCFLEEVIPSNWVIPDSIWTGS